MFKLRFSGYPPELHKPQYKTAKNEYRAYILQLSDAYLGKHYFRRLLHLMDYSVQFWFIDVSSFTETDLVAYSLYEHTIDSWWVIELSMSQHFSRSASE